MVSLTFDDGPDQRWTPLILDALSRAAVTATFFVVAEQMAEPAGVDLVEAIVRDGHAVEAHCARHVRHAEQDRAQLIADIQELLASIAKGGVSRPRLWRPPYGSLNRPESFEVASGAELQLVLWTSDPRDYRDTPGPEMLKHVSGSLHDDSVILLHDSRRYASTSDSAANTVALIEPLAEAIRGCGFELGPLRAPVAGRPRRPDEDSETVPVLSGLS